MKKDEKKLFSLLKKEISPDFDKKFWKEFRQQNTRQKRKLRLPEAIFNKFTIPAACSLIVLLLFFNNRENLNQDLTIQDFGNVDTIELIENLEMLEEMDDFMLELSEEEWDDLLAQN